MDRGQALIPVLAQALLRGGHSISNVAPLTAQVIQSGAWMKRDRQGEEVIFNPNEFRQFVEAHPPVGLGSTIATIEALCHHEPLVMDFLAAAKQNKPGRPKAVEATNLEYVNNRGRVVDDENNEESMEMVYNIHHLAAKGTSSERAYNRLRNAAYDLDDDGQIVRVKDERIAAIQKRVLSKEIKPHAGMIEAGFRSHTASFKTDDIKQAIRQLLKHFSLDEILDHLRTSP